jgi:hypothetical protein
MSTNFERDVSARRAADQLPVPRLDLDAIRRVGRRRRVTSFTVAALAAAVLAGGTAAGVLHLPTALSRVPGHPGASASPHPSPADPNPSPASPRTPTASPRPSATSRAVPAGAMADVRAFYSGYPAAARQGQATVDALIRSYAVGWYAPILEAPDQQGYALGCLASAAPSGLDYASAGLAGGQAIIAVSSSDASGQVLYAVVTADPGTGKITGIACADGGQPVTAAGARDWASALYHKYLALRRQGASAQDAVTDIVSVGADPVSGPYLVQLQSAAVWPDLTYDPLLCTSAGLPNVSVTAATVVADGSAGVVVLTPSVGHPIVAVVVLGAQGWAVAAVACHQP